MIKANLSEPLRIMLDDLKNNEEAKEGVALLNAIKQRNNFLLIQEMHANAMKAPKKCSHKRTKYRLVSWACLTRTHKHEQGFTSALTCRDCGKVINIDAEYPLIGVYNTKELIGGAK